MESVQTPKKKYSGKKHAKKRYKRKKQSGYNAEIRSLLIISIGILVCLSQYSSNLIGIFGDFIRIFFRGMLGIPSFVLPIIILLYGLFSLFGKANGEFRLRLGYAMILIVLASGIIHSFHVTKISELEIYSVTDFLNIMNRYFRDASAVSIDPDTGLKVFGFPQGGGIGGALLSLPLLWVFRRAGALVILYTLFIIFLILMTNISLVNFIVNLRTMLAKVLHSIGRKAAKARRTLEENQAGDSEENSEADEEIHASDWWTEEENQKAADAMSGDLKRRQVIPFAALTAKKEKKLNDGAVPLKEKQAPPGDISAQDEDDVIETGQNDISVHNRISTKDASVRKNREEGEDRTGTGNLRKTADAASENQDGDLSAVPINKVDVVDGKEYVFPPTDLLNTNTAKSSSSTAGLEESARKLVDTLASFGVSARVLHVSKGPSVTRYELQPSVGVKVKTIVNLADDIALNLAAPGVRIEAPIPGKAAIGIEVPNKEINFVYFRDVVESPEFKNSPSKLTVALGRDIAGEPVMADIAKMPHLLIAGATGSGKSVCINTLITSILYKASPKEVKFVMIDPKVVELGIYNGIPHLLIPVVTEPKKAAGALNWAVKEMENRYRLFASKNVRDLKGYNRVLKEEGSEDLMPQIVIIIDELADLMMVAPHEVEDSICRLAQMARAAGMHLVIATQRPSVDVITGVIKANIPSRIAFAVSSQVDSRTILDMAGAEKLLGRGDMLYYPVGKPKPIRVQCSYIDDKEVEAVVDFIKGQFVAEYDDDVLDRINREEAPDRDEDAGDNDELLPQAIELVVEQGQASASFIQRKFKVGYARAARILDQMEARGIVGKAEGSKPRQVLITRQQWMEMTMARDDYNDN